MLGYTITSSEEGTTVSVLTDSGTLLVADESHPSYDEIVECLIAGEPCEDLFDTAKAAGARFAKITERVAVQGGGVYFDGDRIDNACATQIVRFLDEGVEDFSPLVAFFEKVQTNPNEHSREQLYTWLANRAFTITSAGDIVGYKGVDRGFLSIHSGRAIVDGTVVVGRIPNEVGSIIEMPRSEVTHDPSQGCHTGLHVGTYEYANGFTQGPILEVHVNPRDVVSVPTDCSWAKVRTCRYTVVRAIDQPYTESVLWDEDAEDEDEEFFYADEEFWGDGEGRV